MAYIYWSVRPEIFQLGPLAVRWYGLFFALLFAIGYMIGRWEFRSEHKSAENLDTLLIYVVGGTIIGARLGHCFFYEPAYFLRHPLEIFAVWQGGLASHGGALGVLTALYLYSRHHPGQPYLWLLDRVVVPTALGGCFIRLGNLFNSEILGEPANVPWAFVFQRVDSLPRHPAQLYESAAYLLIFVFLLLVYRQLKERTPHGLLTGLFLILVFTARFLIEFVKERQESFEKNLPLSMGQLLSIPFILAGIFLAVGAWRSRRDPGAAARQTPKAKPGEKAAK